MTTKIHIDSGSGSCRRFSVVASHLNMDVEEVFVDLIHGDKDFLREFRKF